MLKDTTVSLNFVKCMFSQKDWHDTQTSAETVRIKIKMRFIWWNNTSEMVTSNPVYSVLISLDSSGPRSRVVPKEARVNVC